MAHWTEQLFLEQADTFATFFERRADQAREDVTDLLGLLASKNHHPKRVLDVPCGTGHHALAFADANRGGDDTECDGIECDGIDISQAFIDRAESLAADHSLDDGVSFHVEDMRELDDWPNEYDLITNIWNSLGYYDRETDVQILTDLRRLLTPGGVLVVELTNKDHHLANFEPASVHELDDHLHVTRTEYDVETGRNHTTVDVFAVEDGSYDHRDTLTFQPRLYALVELRELCAEAGFTTIDLYGDFDGSLLTVESPRVVAIAR